MITAKNRKLNTGTNDEGLKGTLSSSLQMRQKNIAWKIAFRGHFRQITLERRGKNSLKLAKDRV